MIEKDLPGFEIGKHEQKMGIRGSQTTELIFKDCHIPKENLVGEEGKGFKYAMQTLDGGRVGVAAQALGIAQGALEEAVKFAKERVQFPVNQLATKQAIQWMLADMETQIQAARLLVYNAAAAKDRGVPFSKEAAIAKLLRRSYADYVCTKAVQVHGGYGYIQWISQWNVFIGMLKYVLCMKAQVKYNVWLFLVHIALDVQMEADHKMKIITKEEAVHLIKDGDFLGVAGFVGCAHPETLTSACEENFLKNRSSL